MPQSIIPWIKRFFTGWRRQDTNNSSVKSKFDARLVKEIGQEIGSAMAKEVIRDLRENAVPSSLGSQSGIKEEIRMRETYVSPLNQAEEEQFDHNFNELEIEQHRSSDEELEKTIKALRSQR